MDPVRPLSGAATHAIKSTICSPWRSTMRNRVPCFAEKANPWPAGTTFRVRTRLM